MRGKSLFCDSKASSCRLQPFTDFRAARAQHDFFQPAFRGFQFFFAMGLQRLAAFIQGDGILKIDLALLQAGNDGFQLPERALKAQLFDGLVGRLWIAQE